MVVAVFAWTGSSSDAIDVAKAAAVQRGFQNHELDLRSFKHTQCLGGLLGEEAFVEFRVKDSNWLQTVRVDLSRNAFRAWWQVDRISLSPPGE